MSVAKKITGLSIAMSFMLISNAILAEDCLQSPKKNCVDLCKVDPGNHLNHIIESKVKIGSSSTGSCTITNHGETYRGYRKTTTYRVAYFDVCPDQRYEKIEENSYCDENP